MKIRTTGAETLVAAVDLDDVVLAVALVLGRLEDESAVRRVGAAALGRDREVAVTDRLAGETPVLSVGLEDGGLALLNVGTATGDGSGGSGTGGGENGKSGSEHCCLVLRVGETSCCSRSC